MRKLYREVQVYEPEAENIRPLPIFKQVITMFCDVNSGLMGDDSLKDYHICICIITYSQRT